MIYAADCLIVVAQVAQGQEKVVSCRDVELGKRIDLLDPFAEGGNPGARNDIVWKWATHKAAAGRIRRRGCRVEDRQVVAIPQPAEISAPLRSSRHIPLPRRA